MLPCRQGTAREASPPLRRGVGKVKGSHAEASPELEGLRVEVAELLASRRRLALADDAERRAMERDLHRGVQQHLVAFAANLQLATGMLGGDPSGARALLEAIAQDLELALDEAQRLAQRIYPPLLDSGGLAVAIRSAAMSANLPTRLDVEPHAAYPPEVARAVYVCCIGVFERVAAGTEAAVVIRDKGAALEFEVVADCRPADVDMLLLRDRVEALGGRLTVELQAGAKTRVAGSIPVSK